MIQCATQYDLLNKHKKYQTDTEYIHSLVDQEIVDIASTRQKSLASSCWSRHDVHHMTAASDQLCESPLT